MKYVGLFISETNSDPTSLASLLIGLQCVTVKSNYLKTIINKAQERDIAQDDISYAKIVLAEKYDLTWNDITAQVYLVHRVLKIINELDSNRRLSP